MNAAAPARLWRDLSLTAVTAGLVATLVGFTSSIAIIFSAAQGFGADAAQEGGARLDLATGKLSFGIPVAQSRVITETLAAVLFIQEQIEKKGYTLSTMGEQAKRFIANWESEKYRKSLLGAKA